MPAKHKATPKAIASGQNKYMYLIHQTVKQKTAKKFYQTAPIRCQLLVAEHKQYLLMSPAT